MYRFILKTVITAAQPSLGIGLDYKFPHAYGGYVKQQYLPDNLYREGVRYYEPTENGSEAAFKKFLEGLKKL